MPDSSNPSTVIIHWPRLGPYHVARIRAATEYLAQHDLRLIAMEIFSSDEEYLWEQMGHQDGLERHTLFPRESAKDVSKGALSQQIWSNLDRTQPLAVAINGYSSWDTWCLLAWCRVKGALPILMSDSKWDDAPRKALGEAVKRLLVGQYGSALCAGTPQRKYLEGLGMHPHKIFDGYDAVDNEFFGEQSDKVREAPDHYRNLPGLEDKRPYFLASGRFIPRKNFSGLLQAYAVYEEQCLQNGRASWRLLLLGDGPGRDSIVNDVQTLGLQSDVILAGVQTLQYLPAYYGLASAFIHPALQDQWGLVVNEAMASGLPVLVSERAGCAFDLVENGVEGFTFVPEDAEGLGHLMYRMSSGMVDLEQIGMAARRKISKWGVERFSQALYQALRVGWSG